MKKLMFPALMVIASGAALASGSWSSVSVSGITNYTTEGGYAATGGIVLVEASAAASGSPSCGSGNSRWFVIDTSTGAGAYAALLIQRALTAGTTFSASGTGTCGIVSSMETLGSITVVQ